MDLNKNILAYIYIFKYIYKLRCSYINPFNNDKRIQYIAPRLYAYCY